MDLRTANDSESRFVEYVEGLVSVIGHADRAGPPRLMLPCERKSVEPLAAVTAPERTAAQHQSLLHFVGNADWSDERVLSLSVANHHASLPVAYRLYLPQDWAQDRKRRRKSSVSLGSAILKGVGGAASITTPRCALQPTDS
jgi:SRSO17 transposase